MSFPLPDSRFLQSARSSRTLASGVALLIASALNAETLTVCTSGPCSFNDIQSAIDSASDDDVIQIAAGTYTPSATLVTRGKKITLVGAVDSNGNPKTVIDGSNLIRVVECWSSEGPDTRFENLVITNGFGSDGYGGGMSNFKSSPTIVNCHFIGNSSADVGGGLLNVLRSAPIIERCTFIGNTAIFAGGVVMNEEESKPIYRDCIFMENQADFGGGVANLKGHGVEAPSFEDCVIENNQATFDGGGVHNDGTNTKFIRSRISMNVAGETGGGIKNKSSVPTLLETVVCGNAPDQIEGSWEDLGGNTVSADCPVQCAADFNDDGRVDGADFGFLLASWGICSGCQTDLNGDGVVSGADLGELLAMWGPCS